ncbi:AAA family ATPase [uncultured Winogradskyella sp.]|uniref:AAA family ATPase n=1 Tax=uncultured Winogradskyella sp. TaxID=395353 RepID=UPI002614BE13|nr:AAA family ATPase [uncultured Winogradskyella sp.]
MIQNRIAQILHSLNINLYEREEAINLTLLAALAGESIFLLGKPGVAKSLIARRLKEVFKDGEAFEYLMHRFSTPDEIFGPIAISKLKDDDTYERKTEHYLPQADVVFLDEIWKAGPSIQNTLLTVINEKIYRNGQQVLNIPLKALIAASNELPAKNEGLGALWDRFIVRLMVNPIQNQSAFESYLSDDFKDRAFNIPETLKITNQEYVQWQEAINDIKLSQPVIDCIHTIRHYIEEYNKAEETKLYISDRRWKKIVRLLKTAAFCNNRQEVTIVDGFLISHTIWDHDNQIPYVNQMVQKAITVNTYPEIEELQILEEEITNFETYINKVTQVEEEVSYQKPIQVDRDGGKYYMFNQDLILKYRGDYYNYLKEEDFNKLNNTRYKAVQFFYFQKYYAPSYYSDSYKFKIKRASENSVWIKDRYGNKTEMPFICEEATKKEILFKQPNQETLKLLDKKATDIIKTLVKHQKNVQKLQQSYKLQSESHVILNGKMDIMIQNGLNQTLQAIMGYHSKVLKLKARYESPAVV